MKVDWGKIVTNAISTLVAGIVIGAGAIIWNGVSTVGSRIEEAKVEIKASVEILSDDIFDLQDEIDGLRIELAEHNDNIPQPMEEQMQRGSRDMRQEAISDKIKTKANTYK